MFEQTSGILVWHIRFFSEFPKKCINQNHITDKNITPRGYGFKFDSNKSWGTPTLIRHQDIELSAKNHALEEAKIIYLEQPPPKVIDYCMHGMITYRVISDVHWADVQTDIKTNPSRFLYLPEGNQLYPKRPINEFMVTHESRMRFLLENVADLTGGVTTFIVGHEQAEFRIDDKVLHSLVKIPLAYEGMKEGQCKTVRLREEDPGMFKVFQKFIYTLEVSDHDLKEYALLLFKFAHMYEIFMLRYICEYYICWRIQNTVVSPGIAVILQEACVHDAPALKKACFQMIYTYGTAFLSSPEFDNLPQQIAIELLRFFATQREVHMPEVLKQPIPDKGESNLPDPSSARKEPPPQPLPQQPGVLSPAQRAQLARLQIEQQQPPPVQQQQPPPIHAPQPLPLPPPVQQQQLPPPAPPPLQQPPVQPDPLPAPPPQQQLQDPIVDAELPPSVDAELPPDRRRRREPSARDRSLNKRHSNSHPSSRVSAHA